MIWPLFKKELWASRKILLMFMALLSIYGVVIVALYDPTLGSVLDLWLYFTCNPNDLHSYYVTSFNGALS